MSAPTVARLSMTFTTPPALSEKKGQNAPLSPPVIDLLYTKEDKDTMAYEHDRARQMKALDRARTKAKKAFTWGNGASRTGTKRRDGSYAHARGKSPRPPLSEEASKDTKEEGRELASEYRPIGMNGSGRTKANSLVYNVGTPLTEVKLADLVVFAGSRKTKKEKGGLDGEFEIIPHVRSVIVLEDGVGSDELDEAWECVQVEDNAAKAGKTYARVAAAGMEGK